jgi:hypothetical protein
MVSVANRKYEWINMNLVEYCLSNLRVFNVNILLLPFYNAKVHTDIYDVVLCGKIKNVLTSICLIGAVTSLVLRGSREMSACLDLFIFLHFFDSSFWFTHSHFTAVDFVRELTGWRFMWGAWDSDFVYHIWDVITVVRLVLNNITAIPQKVIILIISKGILFIVNVIPKALTTIGYKRKI